MTFCSSLDTSADWEESISLGIINPTKGGAEGKSFHLGHAHSGAERREYVSIEVEDGC